ncbi:copper chaperone PCu(A)C [Aliiroseovarius sp.]|uniref:copper chaperone PCu(A)C n=1 Tax=Aliiroseovarius sp. TaxID=1872442 RepID=UPI002605FDAF|nr:copper chaperone PCu(A)C [Aliiroseovarius sp.]
MSLTKTPGVATAALTFALTFALPAFAESRIMIEDAYARAAGVTAMAGAAFMQIVNTGDEDDRLIGARSDIARRVELHTHIENDQGVMQMTHVKEGFAIPAGETHLLKRGGDHVMFMGLTGSMDHGASVTVTLVFEKAGEMVVEIPVDLERKPMQGMSGMSGGSMGQGSGN